MIRSKFFVFGAVAYKYYNSVGGIEENRIKSKDAINASLANRIMKLFLLSDSDLLGQLSQFFFKGLGAGLLKLGSEGEGTRMN